MRQWLIVIGLLLLLPSVIEAASGWKRVRTSLAPKSWSDAFGLPDCATDPDLIEWGIETGGAAGTWTRCGTLPPGPLQDSQEAGDIGGFTNLLEARPFVIWPEHDTLGMNAPKISYYGESGNIIRECTFGDPSINPCEPETIHIADGTTFRITYTDTSDSSIQEAGTVTNTAGVLAGTGMFARKECRVLTNVDLNDDNQLFASFNTAITVKQAWCHYQGSTPTLAAAFSLVGMTHSAITCAAPTAAATPQAVTVGDVAAFVPIRTSVTNDPDPDTDSYLLCLAY